MNIKKEIENLLKKSLETLGVEFEGNFNLEDHPKSLKNVDWATNLALQLAGKEGKNPREFAEQIRASIPENNLFEKIEVAGPGYLNFYLDDDYYWNFISKYTSFGYNDLSEKIEVYFSEEELKKPIFGKAKDGEILLEHSSPNLFKPFHIGHMVNNSIGESLSRILRRKYLNVDNVAFPSDVSPGIAKTIWALKKEKKLVENLSLQEIADAYVLGTAEFKESDEVKNEVEEINDEIYRFLNGEEIENVNIQFYLKGKELSLYHFIDITKKLGSNFYTAKNIEYSNILFESVTERVGKEIVKNNLGSVFKEVQNEDGTKTIIFEGEQYTNVFINSQGYGTYLTKDTGLLKIKKDKFPEVKKSLVITDVEQKQHFEMVKEAGEKIPEISDFVQKSEYLQHGRMKFAGNIKISSRYGNVPLAFDVIERVQENILEKMAERDFSEEEKKEISEKLAIATLKYSILKVTSGKNISFDLEKDTDPQGNTGTFLMYSLVRANSILNKGKKHLKENTIDRYSKDTYGEKIPEVVKKLERFEDVIWNSIDDYSSHHLANYLYDLAKEFNSYYSKVNFLKQENTNKKNLDLAIIVVFSKFMKYGLNLLGIEVVEKM